MATFIVEEWVESQAGDGRFVRVKGLIFGDHRKAHEKLEDLIAAGKLSERAVVVLYSEPSNEIEI